MSKSMIEAFIKGQYNAINAKDNKERLRFTVAGIRNGRFYALDGTDYGLFDENAPDAEFIVLKDLELSRITGAKIQNITNKMLDYFNKYGVHKNEGTTDEKVNDSDTEATTENGSKMVSDESQDVLDVDAVVKECKKAIKKGKSKKALKLAQKIEMVDVKTFKKLMKKIGDM
jgi:rubrerythrin